MEIKLQKWGNSFGIRIPKSIITDLDIKENDLLDIREEDKKLIIVKKEKEKVSLLKLFQEYKGENLTKEFEWDEARGNEIW